MDRCRVSNEDATRLSEGQVLDQFQAAIRKTPGLTVSDFFAAHPNIDRECFLVPTIIADIRRLEKTSQPLVPRNYFEQFEQLATDEDAWKVLEAAESWLVANEGPNWVLRWGNDYPLIASRFESKLRDSSTSKQKRGDLDLDDLQPGDRLLDYQIKRFVGEGTFGRVYLANDLTLDRQCALKVTIDQGNEGQVLAQLSHPGIVHVYREQAYGGKKILSMQFVHGQSLADWIQTVHSPKHGEESVSNGAHVVEALRLVRDLATSLQHAHVRGVLHRDIKPANVLMNQAGQPMLSDFNVATLSDSGRRFSVGGTINYMSPEQLQAVSLSDANAEQRVDIRSDIYSLGVVLLEMLTGQKVWSISEANSQDALANQLLAARVRSGPPSIASQPGVSPALAAIVDKALNPNTSLRYQSAGELETDLSNWIANRDNAYAANPSRIERIVRNFRRNWNLWLAFSLCMLVVIALMFYFVKVDGQRAARCAVIAQQAKAHLANRQLSRASESLGQAKAQLRSISITRWLLPDRYEALVKSVTDSSADVSRLEAQRFSSLFGEISLREVHQPRSDGLTDLIQDSLRSYKVMTSPDWQNQSPFIDLPEVQKEVVAEGITELILVSMYRSASKSAPTAEKVAAVLNRLPRQHQHFALFSGLLETQRVRAKRYQPDATIESFESYLLGVLATLDLDHESASRFYADSLHGSQRERFWCHYRYAYTCQELKRPEEAFIHYGACIGLQPDFAWPKFNMGLACLDRGRPGLAETYIRQAIKIDKKFTAAYVALTAIQTEQEDYEGAIRTYQTAERQGLSSPELTNNYSIAKSKLELSTIQLKTIGH